MGVLVLGMHRSGTSALAGVLGLLGLQLGRDLLPAAPNNQKGHFESRSVVRYHDDLLRRLESAWDDFMRIDFGNDLSRQVEILANLLSKEFPGQRSVALKDPRMCRLAPLAIEAMKVAGRQPVAILAWRHPLEVADSLANRDGFATSKSLLLWLRHVLSAESATREIPRVFINYDDLLDDWRGAVAKIGRELNLYWPAAVSRAAADIDRFLDTDLRHNRIVDQAPAWGRQTPLVDLCEEALAALGKLTKAAYDPAAERSLDAIAARLEASLDLLRPYLHDARVENGRLKRELVRAESLARKRRSPMRWVTAPIREGARFGRKISRVTRRVLVKLRSGDGRSQKFMRKFYPLGQRPMGGQD